MVIITNKKYQPIKVYISDKECITIEAKESKRVLVKKYSKHMEDLASEGLISIKKIEEPKKELLNKPKEEEGN